MQVTDQRKTQKTNRKLCGLKLPWQQNMTGLSKYGLTRQACAERTSYDTGKAINLSVCKEVSRFNLIFWLWQKSNALKMQTYNSKKWYEGCTRRSIINVLVQWSENYKQLQQLLNKRFVILKDNKLEIIPIKQSRTLSRQGEGVRVKNCWVVCVLNRKIKISWILSWLETTC